MDSDLVGARVFTVAITAASRALMLRDRLLRVTHGLRRPVRGERFFFESGGRKLDGAWVAAAPGKPSVLLCHGIGETVEHWCGVQALLQDHGVGSLLFDYSGYGRSEGPVSWKSCEENTVSAYRELSLRAEPTSRVFVLGFSLGSGIAGSAANRLDPPPAGLFLCEAFPSFRRAAEAAGVPRRLVGFLPDIWKTVDAVRDSALEICRGTQRCRPAVPFGSGPGDSSGLRRESGSCDCLRIRP